VYGVPLAEVIHVETPLAGATPNGMKKAKGSSLANAICTILEGMKFGGAA
jgi:hypothetical protein